VALALMIAVNAASFPLSARSCGVCANPNAPGPCRSPTRSQTRGEGLAALAVLPLLKALAAGQFLAVLSVGAASALLVVLAQDRLGGGSSFGCSLPRLALAPSLDHSCSHDVPHHAAHSSCSGPTQSAASSTSSRPSLPASPSPPALVFYGLSTSTGAVTFSSLVQSRVTEDVRGRAFVGFDRLWQTGRFLSLLGGLLLADAVSTRAVYALGGRLLVTAAAVGSLAARAAAGLNARTGPLAPQVGQSSSTGGAKWS